MRKHSRKIIDDLLQYAVRFAEQNDEPRAGHCWRAIETARAHLGAAEQNQDQGTAGQRPRGSLPCSRRQLTSSRHEVRRPVAGGGGGGGTSSVRGTPRLSMITVMVRPVPGSVLPACCSVR